MDKGPSTLLTILVLCTLILALLYTGKDNTRGGQGGMGKFSSSSLSQSIGKINPFTSDGDEEGVLHNSSNTRSQAYTFSSVFSDFEFIFSIKNFRAMDNDDLAEYD